MPDRITPVEERLAEPPPPRQSETDERLNAVIAGQYRIEEKIGDGGMGTVYKCTDLAVNRIVAVKILHPHLIATSKWFLRFQQEAKAIARLQHRNIINMHHFSPADDAPFIVMDYVSGWALSDILSHGGKLPIERTLKIISQVADALAHAHANGVVHRDLKPSNIMILDLTDDEIKILDFGIAQIADDNANLTQTGEVFGSPAYMSPEQCEGKKIDARSDQYSLGCVLFECLTGTPPFAATSSIHVMMQQIKETAPTLKEASLGHSFPENLEYAARKLLAKDPADRFKDMDEVMRTIQGRPAPALKPESKAKANKLPIYAAVVATILLLLGVLTVIVLQFNSQAPKQTIAPPPASIADVNLPAETKANLRLKAQIQSLPPDSVSFTINKEDHEITDDALSFFSALPKLETLDLQDCLHIGDHGIKNLVAANVTNLAVLGLQSTKVGDEGIKSLVELKKLRTVQLSDMAITNDGVALLKKLPALVSLNLSDDWQLTGKALSTISQFPSLIRLVLRSDIGIVDGIKYLENSDIEILDLKDTPVQNEHITYLAKMKHLKELNLSKTGITEDSIETLAKMTNLEKLNLDKCDHFPPSAILKLKSRLPNWKSEDF